MKSILKNQLRVLLSKIITWYENNLDLLDEQDKKDLETAKQYYDIMRS